MSASSKQLNFLTSLLSETEAGLAAAAEQGAADVLAAVTEALTPEIAAAMKAVRDGSALIESRDASKAIDALLKKINPMLKPFTAVALPVGLASFNAEKVISNRFAKGCNVCSERVDAGAGHALLVNGSWLTICKACAEIDPADREAALAAEREEARARVAAEQAERQAREQARQVVRAEAIALSRDLFARAGVAGQSKPDLHLAIDNVTGSNDLDFFRVVRISFEVPAVYRIIGGHNDQHLAHEDAVKVLERIACTENIAGAMAAYGREIGRCGRCHRTLTDEDSRAAGLGPDCASKMGALIF
jgi:hypothetical protein